MLQSAGIQNTGFETTDSGQIGNAQMWNGANLTKDKRTCNTISPPATYSHTGDCAFLFKGGIGEKSKISQKVKLGARSLVAGSPLTLSAWVSSSSNTVLAQVVAYHTDATRIAFSVLMGPSAGYTRFASAPFYLLKTTSKFKVSFRHVGGSGKLYLDDVELIVSAAPSRAIVLPLPEPPSGTDWRSP